MRWRPKPSKRSPGQVTSHRPKPALRAQTMTAAAQVAQSKDQPVEVADAETASTSTFELPDGSRLLKSYAGPVHVQQDGGQWADVDNTLVSRDGRLAPAVSAQNVTFSAGGTDHSVLSWSTPVGDQASIQWPSDLPTPVLDGAVIRYPDIEPGVDLEFRLTVTGFDQRFILTSRPDDTPMLRLPLQLSDGVTASLGRGNRLIVTGSDDAVMFRSGRAIMTDARVTDGELASGRGGSANLAVSLQNANGQPTEVFEPSAAFLDDPSTVFPVAVDPNNDVATDYNTPFSGGPNGIYTDGYDLMSGYTTTFGNPGTHRALVHFDVPANYSINGSKILSSTLYAWNRHSPSCTWRETDVYEVTSNWGDESAKWSDQPTYAPTAGASTMATYGASGCPTTAATSWDVKSIVQHWADDPSSRHGLMLRAANETDTTSYRDFDSTDHNFDNTTPVPPDLEISSAVAPSAPASVTATAGDTTANVSWTYPTSNGGSVVTGYTIQRKKSTDGGSTWTSDGSPQTVSGSTLSLPTVTGLTNGTQYKWAVSATNVAGTGPATTSAPVTPSGKPQPVGNPAATSYQDGMSKVTWTAPASNGDPIDTYQLQLFQASGTLLRTVNVAASSGPPYSSTFTGLTDGSSYYVLISAHNKNGYGATASTGNFTPSATPGPVQALSVTAADRGLAATWNAPANSGGDAVTAYTLTVRRTSDGVSMGSHPVAAGSNPISASFGPGDGYNAGGDVLVNGTAYYATVTATNHSGTGALATSSNVTPVGTPGTPGGVTATQALPDGAGHTTVTVTWTAASPNGPGIDHYSVQPEDNTPQHNPVGQPVVVCGTCSSANVTLLAYNTTYVFAVTAHNLRNGSDVAGTAGVSSPLTTDQPPVITKAVSVAGDGLAQVGQPLTYTITMVNPNSTQVKVDGITDTLPASLDLNSGNASIDASLDGTPCGVSGGLCSVAGSPATLSVGQILLDPGQTRTLTYTVVLNHLTSGTGSAVCQSVTNAATASTVYGPIASTAPVTACDTGLGIEPWWTYLSKSVGATSTASVNVANGNLALTATDATPVQAHGHLDLVLRRSYNSQDTSLASLPGSFGDGWLLSVGQTDALAGDGVTSARLSVPSVQGAVEQALNPLDITLIDRDGTRHVFTPKTLPGLDVGSLTPLSSPLAPRAVTKPAGYTNLCIDQAYQSPPGVHLGLWRYIAVQGTGSDPSCTAGHYSTDTGTSGPVVVGYATERPDRLRTEFNPAGQIVAMSDGAGATLRYAYNGVLTGDPSSNALAAVYDDVTDDSGSPLCTTTTTAGLVTVSGPCRKITFSYPSSSETDAVDPAGRTTKYLFHTASLSFGSRPPVTERLLGEVDNDVTSGTPISTLRYSYQGDSNSTYGPTTCGASPGQMCSATDERGNQTTFAYTSAPSGFARLTSVTDRRGFATTLDYQSGHTNATATGGAVANRGTAYNSIDPTGRVGQVLAGPANVTSTNALRATNYYWDQTAGSASCEQSAQPTNPNNNADNDLCEVVQAGSANPSNPSYPTPNADTVYRYNDAGTVLRTDRSAARGTGTNPVYSGDVITTSGYHRQWFYDDNSNDAGDETITDNGSAAVTEPTTSTGHNVLFTLADQTQSLPARGAADPSHWQQYLTTNVVDDGSGSVPNTSPLAGTCTNSGNPTGNTGLTCQTSHNYGPVGSPTAATTSYSYDQNGQLLTKLTPNAAADGGNRYTYAYYPTNAVDLSGSTPANGWLASVTDPDATPRRHFVAYGYDAAGNTVRTWDRNATDTHNTSDYPGSDPDHPGPGAFSQTLYGPGGANNAIAHPWRWITSSTDQVGDPTGYTTDELGDTTTVTSPNGGTSTTYYDPEGNAYWSIAAQEAATDPNAGTFTTFDAYGEATSMSSPDQSTAHHSDHTHSMTDASHDLPGDAVDASTTYSYDTVGQQTAATTVRGASPVLPTSANCHAATGTDAPALQLGQTVCSTTKAYDTLGNVVSSQDATAAITTTAYDAMSRPYRTQAPSNGTTSPVAWTNVDADGHAVDACTPNQMTRGNGVCDASSVYASHTSYDLAGWSNAVVKSRNATLALTTTMLHDPDGNTIETCRPRQTTTCNPSSNFATVSTYNDLDRPVATATPRTSTLTVHTYTVYDPSGDVQATVADGTASDNPDGSGNAQNYRITGYSYDPAHRSIDTVTGLQVSELEAAGQDPSLDTDGNRSAITDALGTDLADHNGTNNVRTRSVYDLDGNQVETYSPRAFDGADSSTVSSPDDRFRITATFDADDRQTGQYTPRYATGTTLGIDDPNSGASSTQADQCTTSPDGLPAAQDYPSGTHVCVTEVSHDADGNPITTKLPAYFDGDNNDATTTATYTVDDLLKSVTGPDPSNDGNQTQLAAYQYDGDGKQTAVTDANNLTDCTTYNPDGTRKAQLTDAGSDCSTTAHRQTFSYDANDEQLTATQTSVGGADLTTTTAYLGDGMISSVSTPANSTTSGAVNKTQYNYDNDGNVSFQTSPDATSTDAANQLGLRTVNKYTLDDLLATTYTPVVASNSAPAAKWRRASYSYDPEGDKTAVATDRITAQTASDTDPTHATVTSGDGGGAQSFDYYPDGRLATQHGRNDTTGNPETITTSYDPDGDLTAVNQAIPATSATGDIPATSAYTNTLTANYYIDGLISSVDDGARTTTASYDGAGSLTARSTATDGDSPQSTTYSYDDADLLAAATAPGGDEYSWTYDAGGRTKSQSNPNSSKVNLGYTDGQNTLRLMTLSNTTSGNVLAQDCYTYDEAFRVLTQNATTATQSPTGTGCNASTNDTYSYGYFPSGAVKSFTNGSQAQVNYTYDHDTNRLTSTGPSGHNHTFTYLADDSVNTETADTDPARQYSYDPDGRRTNDGCSAYGYDGLDRTSGIAKATGAPSSCQQQASTIYQYDGLDRQTKRVSTIPGFTQTTAFGYDLNVQTLDSEIDTPGGTGTYGGLSLYTLNPAGPALAVVRTNASGPSGGAGSDGTQQLTDDGRGSITDVTGQSGAVNCQNRYDPFGQPDGTNSASLTNACDVTKTASSLGYLATHTDASTGNQQYGSRTYDASTAAFTTPDTFRTGPSSRDLGVKVDALTENTYVYANGDPLNAYDPDGHEERIEGGAAGDESFGANSPARTGTGSTENYGTGEGGTVGDAPAGSESGSRTSADSTLDYDTADSYGRIDKNARVDKNPSPDTRVVTGDGNRLITVDGKSIEIPETYASSPSRSRGGTIYAPPGNAPGDISNAIRVMPPDADYPDGYVIEYDEHGNPVNAHGRVPSSRGDYHQPLAPGP